MSRVNGRVKWFSSEKGYGFIEREGAEDVFVHHSEISMEGFRTLDAGEPVEFEVMADDRGPKAHDVRRLEPDGEGSGSAAEGDRAESGASAPEGRGASSRGSRSPAGGSQSGGAAGSSRDEVSTNGELTLVEQIRRKLGGRFFD